MPIAHCADCRKPFLREADETWKDSCLDCFKKRKTRERKQWEREEVYREPPRPSDAHWQRLAERLTRQVREQEAELQRLRLRSSSSSLDKTMVRRLLQLSHPDKHNGSEASRLATQWLLKELEKFK